MSGSLFSQQTGSQTIASGSSIVEPVAAGYYPAEGSRVIGSQYAWGTYSYYNEDMSRIVAQGELTTIQSVYIDNSVCNATVTIFIMATGQSIQCPGGSQGVFPVFFTGMPQFMVSAGVSTAGTYTRVQFLNIPLNSASVWATGSPTVYTSIGQATVTGGSATLIAANIYAKTLTIMARSTNAATAWLNPGVGAAVVGSGLYILPGGSFVFGSASNPLPAGAITAISDGANISLSWAGA